MTAILLSSAEHQEAICALDNAEDALMNCQALLAALKRRGFAETCYGANAIALEFVGPALTMLRAKVPQEPKKQYAWECNECGSQEYTMAVSESDVHELGCGTCGSSEWTKKEATP